MTPRSRAIIPLVFGAIVLAVALGVRRVSPNDGPLPSTDSDSLIRIMLVVLGCFMLVSLALLRPSHTNSRGTKWLAVAWSVALLASLGFTWQVITLSHRGTQGVGATIDSPAALEAFMTVHDASFAPYLYRVPTGVYLQSFEFLSGNDIEMSGFVWQRYGPEIPDSVPRGIVFPEQLEDAYEPVEAWRYEQDGVELIGWYFSGVFRQNFDYSLYPFDQQHIWLRLWHPDDFTVLIPDFDAYLDLNPRTLPGLDINFVYGAWDPITSQFSYDLLDYNVDFGLGYGFSGVPDPELYFSLSVARDSLGPMLDHVILQSVIAILLFLLLILMTHNANDGEHAGLSVFDLVVAAGGLLFAVILDRNSIRARIESQTLTYLEWLPLILSGFIVLVVLGAVLEVKGGQYRILGYNSDRFFVYAYWPALLASILIVTLQVFFFR